MTIGAALPDSEAGQLFGKKCFKTGGKPFIAFFKASMVFKLTGNEHAEALTLADARLFDPSGKGRPMKEWVEVPFAHRAKWNKLATAAQHYVQRLK